eukprot:1251494-Amphidinium_carterae.1
MKPTSGIRKYFVGGGRSLVLEFLHLGVHAVAMRSRHMQVAWLRALKSNLLELPTDQKVRYKRPAGPAPSTSALSAARPACHGPSDNAHMCVYIYHIATIAGTENLLGVSCIQCSSAFLNLNYLAKGLVSVVPPAIPGPITPKYPVQIKLYIYISQNLLEKDSSFVLDSVFNKIARPNSNIRTAMHNLQRG